MFIQFNYIKEPFSQNVQYKLPEAITIADPAVFEKCQYFMFGH